MISSRDVVSFSSSWSGGFHLSYINLWSLCNKSNIVFDFLHRLWSHTFYKQGRASAHFLLLLSSRYVRMNYTKCRILFVFFLFTSFGTYYCMGRFNYSFAAGMYNAISSMSTGGLHAMPIDATDAGKFISSQRRIILIPQRVVSLFLNYSLIILLFA